MLSICSTFFETLATFSVELFLLLLLRLSIDLTDARFSSRFNFSSSFGTFNLGAGGLGFGGGVDLPKECFFGDEIGTPDEMAAEATAEAATGGEARVPEPAGIKK